MVNRRLNEKYQILNNIPENAGMTAILVVMNNVIIFINELIELCICIS